MNTKKETQKNRTRDLIFIPLFLFLLISYGGVGSAEEQDPITIGLPTDPNAPWNAAGHNGIITWNQPVDWSIIPYPILKYSKEELSSLMRAHAEKQEFNLTSYQSIQQADDTKEMKYVSLLSSLSYDPALRDQGSCGNCWVFAPTASLEIQMAKQNMPERLSIQAFNSGWTGPAEASEKTKNAWFACNGGTPDWFIEYYLQNNKTLIPWSNEGAAFTDYNCTYSSCKTAKTPYHEIAQTPAYTIRSLTNGKVSTTGISGKDAADQIKTLIDNDIPVLLALFFPHKQAWQDFYTFWEQGDETTHAFDITKYAGNTWNYAQGGGHQVLITGYYESEQGGYFECLNSWGGPKNRPNGTFLINMNVNYNSAYSNTALAQMFEATILEIGEYISAPADVSTPTYEPSTIRPGIVRT